MRGKRVKLAALLAVPVLLFVAMVPVAQRHREQANTFALLKELAESHARVDDTQVDRVEDLLRRGADANGSLEGGASVLHFAATHDDPKIVRILLDHGANINARDMCGDAGIRGCTPLDVAVAQANIDVVTLLLNRGADPNINVGGQSALGYAQYFVRVGYASQCRQSRNALLGIRMVRMLKAAGAKE